MQVLNQQVGRLKLVVILLSLLPAIQLIRRYLADDLGANPLATLMSDTGRASLWLFVLTLSITPARRLLSTLMIKMRRPYGKRLADWNWLVKLRRSLGVLAFLYATAHFSIYFILDLGMDLEELRLESLQKPFVAAGELAWLLMLPMFLTSTDWAMRRLRKNWRRIHRLMYPVAILVSLHYLWLLKPGARDAWPWVVVMALLLAYRLQVFLGLWIRREDTGMEIDR